MSTERRSLVLAALALAAAPLAAAQEPAAETPDAPSAIVVHLADGSTVPLSGWLLSYEYVSYAKVGGSPLTAKPAERVVDAVIVGKKSLPVAGSVLELAWNPTRPVVERLVLTAAGGKPVKLKVEPPDPSLLAPQIAKDTIVSARSLDLEGDTLTGSHRDFCLVSFSTLVECGKDPADRVVRVEFNR